MFKSFTPKNIEVLYWYAGQNLSRQDSWNKGWVSVICNRLFQLKQLIWEIIRCRTICPEALIFTDISGIGDFLSNSVRCVFAALGCRMQENIEIKRMLIWKWLKSDSRLSKKNLFYLLQWLPFKNDEKCFLFHVKTSFRSQDIYILTFMQKKRLD